MTDFLAGQTLTPLHFTPTVSDSEQGTFSFNSTAYGVDADSGTYADCGVAFTGPASGRVLVHFSAEMLNSSASDFVSVSPVIRTGSTVGAGTSFLAASLDTAIHHFGTLNDRFGATVIVTGLTPGDPYNVRLEHRIGSGANTATIRRRTVIVEPVS